MWRHPQAPLHDRQHGVRQIRTYQVQGNILSASNRGGNRTGGRVAERRMAGGHLVENRSQRPDIGAMVGLVSRQLFRRHIRERTHHLMRCGQPRFVCDAGQTEIEDLNSAGLHQKYFARLDVAMHDAGHMGGMESGSDLAPDLANRAGLKSADLRQKFGERLATVACHHQQQRTVRRFFDCVDGAEIGMIERRCRACFS